MQIRTGRSRCHDDVRCAKIGVRGELKKVEVKFDNVDKR